MRIEEHKYILPDGREITIRSAGSEDAMKVKLHREATSAETHFMAREPEDGQFSLEKTTEILGMSIRQKYTGMGLGSFMMKIALDQAKANGFEQVELGVYSDNDRARYMYKKMGFKEYGMNPRAFKLKDGTYRDEIIMANIFE